MSLTVHKIDYVLVSASEHRWSLPVLRYPINMLIFPYPLFGVIVLVILHVFIIKNSAKVFSNY